MHPARQSQINYQQVPSEVIQPVVKHPELTVVMPVRNESAHVRAVLAQLCDQSLAADRYEILVIDGYSDDDTRAQVLAAAAVHPHIHLLYNAGITSGCGRNIGAAHACSPHILFVDGHCRIESRTMLESALAAFQRGERCLSRPQPMIREQVSLFQLAVAMARGSILGHQTGSQIYQDCVGHCNPLSAGCGYTRELFEDLGGVDEKFDAGEDLEFNLRVHRRGIEAYHDTDLTVSYYPRAGWRALFRQLYRYGYGRALMTRKHPGTVSPPAAALAVFALWLAVLPAAGLLWAPAWTMWGTIAGTYALVTVVHAGQLAGWRPGRLWAAVASCFPAIHLGAGFGYLSGLLGGPGWRHAPRAEVRRRVAEEHALAAAERPLRAPQGQELVD